MAAVIRQVLIARRAQRIVKPPIDAASATVEPNQPTVRMTHRAQSRRNPIDRSGNGFRNGTFAFFKSLHDPTQKRQNVQKLFRITSRNTALSIDLVPTIPRQRSQGRRNMRRHSFERKPRVDHARQRFEPWQTGQRGFPTPRKEQRLPREARQVFVDIDLFPRPHDEKAVVDPADQAPPREVRRPPRPIATPIAVDPLKHPILRFSASLVIPDCSKII